MPLKLKDIIGPAVAAVAVGVGIWQYRSASQSEFIKPVREAQLKLYQEASSAAAQLATLDRGTPDWTKQHHEFLRLYYGPLAIVESFEHNPGRSNDELTVEEAMILFKKCLDNEERCMQLGGNLKDLSLALAHTSRASLGRVWGYNLPQLKGEYQKLALDYRKKLLETTNKQEVTK